VKPDLPKPSSTGQVSRSSRGARSIRKILDAAAEIFGAEGFQGATMHAVARAAGVSKGLLHYHFRSKEHLLLEAQRATYRQIHQRFDERFDRGERGVEPAMDALDVLWESILEMRPWAPFMVETLTLAHVNDTLRNELDSFYEDSTALLERGIQRVFEGDTERLAVEPGDLARIVRTLMHGAIVELAYAKTDEDLAHLNTTYLNLRTLFQRVILSGPITLEEVANETS
jgi:AcrR family transcriptional regulator